MNRDEQEMALWRRVYDRCYERSDYDAAECGVVADAAVEQFRQRYPAEPAAPETVWYDEPPLSKDGTDHQCWVEGFGCPQEVYWSHQYSEWRRFEGAAQPQPLAGRRVCPITKPPEPTT